MDEKKHTLSLSAVWNQLDSCEIEQPRNLAVSRNHKNDTPPQKNHVLLNPASSRNKEIKILPSRSSVRPKCESRNKELATARHNVIKSQADKHFLGVTLQKQHPNHRNYNAQQYKFTDTIAADNRSRSRDNAQSETARRKFHANSRENMQKETIEDQGYFRDSRNNVQREITQDQGHFHDSRKYMQRETTRDRGHFHYNRNTKNQKKRIDEEENTFATDSYRENKPMSFSTLKDLITKHSNEILLSINKKNCGFMILIRQKNIRTDMMALLLISLGRACIADLKQNVSSLLNTICSNKDFLLLSIQKYLVSLRQNLIQDFHLQSLVYLPLFLQKFQQTLPSLSSETISMLLPLLQSKCETFLKAHELCDDVMGILKEISEENEHFLNKHTPLEIKKASYREAMQFCEPPENFRSVPILPNDDDIHSNAFLRPNIVEGKYLDTEQYLDIQYRLLREDYVKPLRDGIADYLALKKAGKSIKNCRDVRVYEDVHIVKQDFVNGGIVHIAEFSRGNFSKVKWEYSKRFLSGSLLCLSSDNYQTMLFASVAQRIPEQLRKGLLLIRFEDMSDEILNLSPLRKFVVIETSAYFEAYRHNLKALHELNEETLAFKRYIVDVENTVESPRYLQPDTTYDMRPLLLPMDDECTKRNINQNGDVSIQYEYPVDVSSVCKSIRILNDSCWPTALSLNLDDSQYLALKAAVTREFAIIQGPPGTGKTYIGLRIVQLLLHNIDKWFLKGINSLPILIVCYTNHALDQFLEGLMRFTNKIVRIGGRGTNEAISTFQLSNLKRNAIAKREIPKYISASVWHKNHELKSLKIHIDIINQSIQKSVKVVFGEKDLGSVIPLVHHDSLKSMLKHPSLLEYNLSDDGLIIHDWLGIRSRTGWNDNEDFELKVVKPQFENNCPVPKPDDTDDVDDESVGEADIEFIEAQRDIDSEEFADVSFEIEAPEKEEFLIPEDSEWQVQGGRKQRLKFIRHCLHNSQPLEEKEAMSIRNVWALPMPVRWQLYKFWVERLISLKQQECMAKQLMLKQQFKEMCEMRTEEDIFILQKAHIVGMTTTGAAKYRDIVLRLNPQILIVEEAAEILESHIVTSLAPKTQHVILIGDHQQLRPSPTVHMLAVKYDLNISLFERMIKNKMDCFRLSIQHRMRPEVADLIVPHIYSDLKNHEVVTKYESIKGVSRNVFFVTHNYSELQENDSKSKINEHEAKFMIKLCQYFVLQGYDPSHITVLTTYTGQLFVMKKLVTDVIRKVRFTVVDNFQGEENDIILISFVRSNEEGEIGFLKIANRVCVALSRAKKGLFCIGNFELLSEKSDLWKGIINTLKEKEAIGPSLQLLCQNHPGVCNVVANEKDFESVPEGGCNRICEYRLTCGHACSLMCHPYDAAHENVRCYKICNKPCEFNHKCPKKCFKECGLCMELIDKKIFPCGHTIKIHCHLQKSVVKCTANCDKILLCGHKCSNACCESCTVVCIEKVKMKSLICGHMVLVECRYKNSLEEQIKSCKNSCNTTLDCGHNCKGNCYNCHQGRLHVACNQPCKRILVCGHECKAPCAKSCPPCKSPCENKCSHSKCPKKCGEPCEVCTEACQWHCEHQRCSRYCGEICNRVPCNYPCCKLLSCGHSCIGFCGEPCPAQCRQCDSEMVNEIFFGTEDEADSRFIQLEDCNHILEVSGLNEWVKVDNKGDQQIQMKACPKCKTVIRTNLRFGNIVKDCLKKIENVKRLTFGNIDDNKKKQKDLLKFLEQNESTFKKLKSGSIYDSWCKVLSSKKCRSIQEITTLENILRVSLKLANIVQYFAASVSSICQDSSVMKGLKVLSIFINSSKNWLLNFIQDEFLTASEQQLHQLTWETHRLHLGIKLLKLVNKHLLKPPFSDFKNCVSVLIKYSPFGDDDVKLFSTSYQSLAKTCGSAVINLLELEKQSILKAMNLATGHWFQCPNGHVYCITDCGGAMEVGRCNECNSKIGGTNHALLSTNRVATDMDGARHAAWSDTMNMVNYGIGLDDHNDAINEHDALLHDIGLDDHNNAIIEHDALLHDIGDNLEYEDLLHDTGLDDHIDAIIEHDALLHDTGLDDHIDAIIEHDALLHDTGLDDHIDAIIEHDALLHDIGDNLEHEDLMYHNVEDFDYDDLEYHDIPDF